MYKSGYVLALIANGQVLEEDDSKRVGLPFGTEYKVRLINKNYDDSAADLIVNGETVARFIINAGETVDIERFLDGNLNSGNKFKFTYLSDSKVKDKHDIDNGLVEVHFYKEKKKTDPIIIREEHHHHYWDKIVPEPKPWPQTPWYYTTCGSTCKGSAIGEVSSITFNANYCATPTSSYTGQEGATIRGSDSDQKFQEVSGKEYESTATILKLKIVNGELTAESKYCSGCGRKRKTGEKFCGNCGTRL